jgi:predicted nuclease of predicted toxin-antitoxin system
MRLLLDQGLPRSAAGLLHNQGIDAIHVGEIGLATAEDVAILAYSRQEQQVVVTLDADFHALLALSHAHTPSVVRIRIEGLRGEALAALLQQVLEQCSEELTLGAVVTVQERRLHIRRLPLSGDWGNDRA